MSWQAFAWADSLDADVVGPLAFRVLMKLANVADEHGQRAWRNKADMARELGRDQRSIRRALQELEYSVLILKGEQEHVHHIRGDRRPTVYNLNLGWAREFQQPELDTFHSPEPRGDTVIHRQPRGDTGGANGVTSDVRLRTFKNLTTNSSLNTNHSTRAGMEKDASGDTLVATETREELHKRLQHQPCPFRAGKEHDYAPGVGCTGCGIHAGQYLDVHKDVRYLSDLLEEVHA